MDAYQHRTELHEAIEAFYFAYRAFTARADRILERRGLSRVHHRVLYFVGRNPEISVQDLLKILAVSKQALNGPLRTLLNKGLITADLAAHDRRVKTLCLSPAGTRLEAALTDAQGEQLQRAFDAAGMKAKEGWSAIMTRLIQD